MSNILIKLLEIGLYLFGLYVACFINDNKEPINTFIIYLFGNWIAIIMVFLERGG